LVTEVTFYSYQFMSCHVVYVHLHGSWTELQFLCRCALQAAWPYRWPIITVGWPYGSPLLNLWSS